MNKLQRVADAAIGFLFSAYFGLIVGVSFIATMAKFQAKLSSLPQLVEIGSITFHWLHAVELVVLALLLLFCATNRTRSWRLVIVAILTALWFIQGFLLLPALDVRVDDLIAGRDPGPSPDHLYFAAIEGLKTILLLVSGYLSIAQSAIGKIPYEAPVLGRKSRLHA